MSRGLGDVYKRQVEGREITRISKQEALYKMYPEIEEIEKGKKKVVRQVESNQEKDQAI